MDKDKLEEVSYTLRNTDRENQRRRSGGDGGMSKTDADKHAMQIRQKGGWDKCRLTDNRGTL